MASAIASAKVSRALKMEKPLYALLSLADSASVGTDPAKAATALDGVTAAAVKKAAAAAIKSGMSMASVGNISEVRHMCVCILRKLCPEQVESCWSTAPRTAVSTADEQK